VYVTLVKPVELNVEVLTDVEVAVEVVEVVVKVEKVTVGVNVVEVDIEVAPPTIWMLVNPRSMNLGSGETPPLPLAP